MEFEFSSVFHVDFTITPSSFFFLKHMHNVITSRALLCNCHEVSKVSSEAIGNILDGGHRESGREFFSTFFQVSFIYETFAFICINKLAGPLKSLHRVAFLRKQLQVKR